MTNDEYLAPCIKCKKPTGHKSMKCMDCRKVSCLNCGHVFAALKASTKLCAKCNVSISKDKKMDLLYNKPKYIPKNEIEELKKFLKLKEDKIKNYEAIIEQAIIEINKLRGEIKDGT